MSIDFLSGRNRCICEVLEEMRMSVKTLNFSYMMGLIEEAQTMANRMEAKLGTIRDWKSYEKEVRELRKEVERLENKKEDLEEDIE